MPAKQPVKPVEKKPPPAKKSAKEPPKTPPPATKPTKPAKDPSKTPPAKKPAKDPSKTQPPAKQPAKDPSKTPQELNTCCKAQAQAMGTVQEAGPARPFRKAQTCSQRPISLEEHTCTIESRTTRSVTAHRKAESIESVS
ncbi:hypothetical protein D6D01_06972 [Aureobasidium pullulans]|uniref:Uncharacterized protein n=1 Tax=Aureobasidium pullulans TaxID=5580 RepID=A0A4S9KVH3_AURPU|nr:hypothetical protein D6D01_06972 [Aureobasidium pullulans]